MAFWEMAHFRQTVRALNESAVEPKGQKKNAAPTQSPADLPDNKRRDFRSDNPPE
jgi:hypothetical protein